MSVPALWRVKDGDGKAIGAYYVTIKRKRINLGTKDHDEAKRRARLATKGQKKFAPDASMARSPRSARDDSPAPVDQGAADRLVAALTGGATLNPGAKDSPAPAASDSPPPAPELGVVLEPERVAPEDASHPAPPWQDAVREATAASSTPSSDSAPPPPVVDPEITDAELAKLGVEAQLWIATAYARQKVWKQFTPPATPPEAREPLVNEWKKILAYCGVATILPPWVMGLVVPAITLCTTTVAMAYAFGEIAKQQRQAAGEPAPADPQPLADGA